MGGSVRIFVGVASLLVLAAMCSQAAAAPLLQVLGGASRTVDVAKKSKGQASRTFDFVAAVEPPGTGAEVKTQLIGFSRDGRVLEFDESWLKYKPQAGRPDRASMLFTIPEQSLSQAGSYTLTVEFWKRTQPPTPEDGKPAGAATNSDEGSLLLTLVRPPGALTLQGPVRIERVIRLPYGSYTLTPSSLLISETTGTNFVGILAPSGKDGTQVQLRSSANSETVTHLTAVLPDSVAAAGQTAATITLTEDTPVGTLTGTLQIVSDQLEPRTFSTVIEVVTRAHRAWLVVLLVSGILLGFVVRVVLEKRKTRKLAEAAARRVRDELKAAIAKVIDETYKNELKSALTSLSDVIGAKKSTADELKAARETAAEQLTGTLTRLEEARSELDQRISTAEADLGSIADFDFEVSGLAETEQLLRKCRDGMNEGRITAATGKLNQELQGRLDVVVSAITTKSDELSHALRLVEDWPELDVAKPLEDARAAVSSFQSTHANLNDTSSIGTALRSLNLLLRRFAQRLVNERARLIAARGEEVLTKLREIPRCKDLAEVAALSVAIENFKQAMKATDGADFSALLTAEGELRTALNAALNEAGHVVPNKPTKPAGLATGRFREALEEVIKAHGVTSLGKAPKPAALPPQKPAPPIEEGWTVRIVTSERPRVGTPLVLSAELAVAEDKPPPAALKTAWWINGAPQQPSGPGGLNCVFTPTTYEQELTVEVEVVGPAPNSRTAKATLRLLVRQSEDREVAAQLEAEAATISGLQTALAGVVIVFAGYAIFQSAFVGSFADITAALFWGFGIDISVAKALEYSTPLTSKPLPQ